MDIEKILSVIRHLAKELAAGSGRTDWYIFGSALKRNTQPGDIDVLVIHVGAGVPGLIRMRLKERQIEFPLHLTFLTVDEAQELDFVRLVGAIPLRYEGDA